MGPAVTGPGFQYQIRNGVTPGILQIEKNRVGDIIPIMRVMILSRDDVRECLSMPLAIQAVKEAFILYSTGKADVPERISLTVERRQGVSLFMPAYLRENAALGMKIVSVFPGNRDLGLPTISAAVIVLDAVTGFPLAFMEGVLLTAIRTGAASGVATDLLARRNARRVAVFGAGIQARTQLEAVCTVRAVSRVRVYDLDNDAAGRFARETAASGPPFPDDVSPAASPSEAVREADIIITATTSEKPVFEHKDIAPGVHINAIGSFQPHVREIPEATVLRSRVFVDSRSAALREAGDLIMPLSKGLISESHIRAEIGEVAGGLKPGREVDDDITLFKSVGLAVQDVAAARIILERAENLGKGLLVDI